MPSRLPLVLLAIAALCGLAACATPAEKVAGMQTEDFDSTTTHTRTFPGSIVQTCEAARRALLSQGYVTSSAAADQVTGRKNFQPQNETHVEVEFRVVCAPAAIGSNGTIAFVSAVQDRFAVKKVNNSASLGLPAFGSLSLPFSSSDDALVKVASETLSGPNFYDRFFKLMQRYMPPPEAAPAPAAVAASAAPFALAAAASAPEEAASSAAVALPVAP